MNVTSRISATGAASLSRGHKPVTANPAEPPLWNFALPQPPVDHSRGYSRTGPDIRPLDQWRPLFTESD